MRVLTKLIYGIFSFNPCNPKKGYRDQKIPLLSMKDLFLYTMPAYYFYSNRRAHRCIILLKKIKKIKRYASPYYWAAFILLDAID